MSTLVEKSRELMRKQTRKNGAPAWLLTEMAVVKGRELAKRYQVDQELVVASLYLAHTVFSKKLHGKIQKKHTGLSAKFVKAYLKRWHVPEQKQKIILNSIEAHHDGVPTKYGEAEVVKNAECYKFLTVKGALILLHDLGRRGLSFEQAAEVVKYKADQKIGYITLSALKQECLRNHRAIFKLMNLK